MESDEGVLDKFRRLFHDPFKEGAERQAKNILYIDPNRIPGFEADVLREKIVYNRGLDKYEWSLTPAETKFLTARISEQLNAYYEGAADNFSEGELLVLLKNSLEKGSFAHGGLARDGICIVNQPNGDAYNKDTILYTFGIAGNFNPTHLRPLPGTSDLYIRLVGEHEGEHCNQETPDTENPLRLVHGLENETKSDRAALATLRAEGHHDVAQAWIDLRVLAAARGGGIHATSIFLDQPDFTGATEEHLAAARTFGTEMMSAVANELGISENESLLLRTADPQRYATAVSNALDKGKIPAPVPVTYLTQQEMIAEKMGITPDELENLPLSRVTEALAASQELKSQGKYDTPGNPYVAAYARQYVGAVQRRMIPDTTPDVTEQPSQEENVDVTPQPSQTLKSPDDVIAELSDEFKQGEAADQVEDIIQAAVAKELGISKDAAYELGQNDPTKYADTIGKLLKDKKIPLETTHPRDSDEQVIIMSQRMGLTIDQLNDMAAKHSPVYWIANYRIEESGAFNVTYQNPYLEKAIEKCLEKYQDTSAQFKANAADMTEPDNKVQDNAPKVENPEESKDQSASFKENTSDVTAPQGQGQAPEAKRPENDTQASLPNEQNNNTAQLQVIHRPPAYQAPAPAA